MKSKTKGHIDRSDINNIFKKFDPLHRVLDTRELTDGYFNISYMVSTERGEEFVLKISPPDDVDILSYEKDLMASEVYFLDQVSGLDAPVPKILFRDFSREIIPYNYFIMEKLHGTPLNKMEPISESQREHLYRVLAKYLAEIHRVEGDHFGYISYKKEWEGYTYFEVFREMFKLLLIDAKRLDITLPLTTIEIDDVLDLYRECFTGITDPVFVHYDLWDGNIFVTDWESDPKIEGLIDFERGFFADPAADFSQVAGYIDLKNNPWFIEEYNRHSSKTFIMDDSAMKRVELYRYYVLLIMVVESYYRDVDGSFKGQLEWATAEFLKLHRKLQVKY